MRFDKINKIFRLQRKKIKKKHTIKTMKIFI